MRAGLPAVFALPAALAGCPLLLSDWEVAANGAVPADAPDAPDAGGDAAADAMDGDDDSLDALGDVDADGPHCVADLSNVGAGDFTIRFTLTTTQTGVVAVLNQRNVCDLAHFWDVRLGFDTSVGSGRVVVSIDDGTAPGIVTLQSTSTVNDGKLHKILVERTSGMLSITIDGAANGAAADNTYLPSLPPLAQGTDVCSNYAPLSGTLTDLCITRP